MNYVVQVIQSRVRYAGIVLFLLLIVSGCGGGGSSRPTVSNENIEAFALAQQTQAHRQSYPFGGNYGRGSVIVTSTAGMRRYPSPIYPGFNARNAPKNVGHSEVKTHDWIVGELTTLRRQHTFDTATSIQVVIFSQVIVCPPCRTAAVGWQKEFQGLAGIRNLTLSIWQLTPASQGGPGFDPGQTPSGKNVNHFTDVQKVPIAFMS